MNPILLARHVQDSLRELVHSSLNTSSQAFEGMVDRFLSSPSNFIKGPWASVDMPFRQIEGAETGDWDQPFPEVPIHFPPYLHQMQAFDRLAGNSPCSTLVATGTGSGKTECYTFPIFDHCREHQGKPGVKAILIYPMNALATDQARRIAHALTTIPALEGIRAGLYADSEPADPAYQVRSDSLITHRDTMRQNPPDILLTNYKMLDLMLLRGRDKPLWAKNDPESLRFLVVDEMHTFDGAQGADLALLIRRLKHRLKTPENHLVCVGSSATLGAGDEARADLRKYAEQIFGEHFDENAVIGETRKSTVEVFTDPEYLEQPRPAEIHAALNDAEEMDQPAAARRLASCLFPDTGDPDLAFIETGDPSDPDWRIRLGNRLVLNHLCQRTLKIIADHPGPTSLDEVAEGLSKVRVLRRWRAEDHRALTELIVALVAWARSGSAERPRPLFNVRLQLWIREMARMVTTLPKTQDDGKRSPIELRHAIDLDQDELRQALPIVSCNHCGASAHIGRQSPDSKKMWAPLETLYDEFFENSASDRIRLLYHEPLDRKLKARSRGYPIVPGYLDVDTIEFSANDPTQQGECDVVPVWMYNPTNDQGRIDRSCPACGQEHGLLLFGMRAARLTTGLTGTLYTSPQNEEHPDAKPRLLMFSDSVQDAAQRAAVAETRNALSVYQKALYQALTRHGSRYMTLAEVIKDLPRRQLSAMGPNDFTALFISKEQTWRGHYQNLTRNSTSIADSQFIDHMQLRLGWEYFADLSYRAHFSHTLECNGLAIAEISAHHLLDSAKKLSSQLRNELPGAVEIDPEILQRFLFGLIHRMRRQGSVSHPYIVAAVGTSKQYKGLNWFGAAFQLGLGKTQTLPQPDFRRTVSPVPITLNGSTPGYERITRPHNTNWYSDWLFRSLDAYDLRAATAADLVYPIALARLEADALVRTANGPDNQGRQVWLVEPQQMIVSTDTTELSCGKCGRRETVLSQSAQIIAGSPCTRIGCDGKLQPKTPAPRKSLRRTLSSDRNHRVVAREHTGILSAEDRLRIEEGFIKDESRWAPNLISATPTLEMGIDIGDLSTVLLSSVPPEEANYVQRMGRSGRRDGNALNLVLANARPHDVQFWEDPRPMLSGEVRPPGVFLQAAEVLLRQVTAFSMDVYVAESEESGDFGKVREAQKHRTSGTEKGFPFEWLNLVEERGLDIANEFIRCLPPEVQSRTDLTDRIKNFLTAKDDQSLAWRVSSAFDAAAEERARLVEKREEITRSLKQLKNRRAELTDEEFAKREVELTRDRKAINSLIRRGIDDVLVIKFLTDRGLLPNYAFPEEGIKLTSILSRRNDNARDEDGLLHLEYSRPASSALSEFAPGQFFYANGRQVRIDRLEMGQDDLDAWTFCPSCSHAELKVESTDAQNCPKCGDEMWSDTGSHHEVVKLKSVVSITPEDRAVIQDADQRDQRQFDRALMPFHAPEQIQSSWFTSEDEGAPFGFEFIPLCTFRDFNFGPKSTAPIGPKIAGERRPAQPFRICRHCGTLQKPPSNDGDPGVHAPNCRVARDKSIARDQWETEVFLMRGFQTEALRIVIPVVGEAEDDDLKSFVAAINLGMRKHFAGKVDHIRSTIFEARLDGMTTVRSLYLYDAVPGGSGYLREIGEHPDTMRAVISRAAEALRDCPCNQELNRNGCFRCVKPYRSQFGPGEPDRDRARHLMEAILQKWGSLSRTSAGIDNSIRVALVDSALESRFLQALVNTYGEASLKPQVLKGGRRGFLLKAGTPDTPRLWLIEPQFQIDSKFSGLPRKRVDFLMTPVSPRPSDLPVVVEMDGLEFHAGTVANDILDRMLMIRSGQVRVWTLSWSDLDKAAALPLNPFSEDHLGSEKIGKLAEVLACPDFAPLAASLKSMQAEGTMAAFRQMLDGQADHEHAARSLLIRGVVVKGRPLNELPRSADLEDENRHFLEDVELTEHLAAGPIDVYLACQKVSPKQWLETIDDLRILIRADLPDPGTNPHAKLDYQHAWRGLWRLINLFQGARGLHIQFEGVDTLSPPDTTSPADTAPGQLDEAWTEVRLLCDETFHPLIDALIAAGAPGPDRIGDDLVAAGRVVGMMEFGWSSANTAVTEERYEGVTWDLVPFTPGSTPVGETVTAVLHALEEAPV